MKVFVAGASGAIGRPLVRQLVAAGHEVTGTTRREERAEEIRAAGADARSSATSSTRAALEAAVAAGRARGRRQPADQPAAALRPAQGVLLRGDRPGPQRGRPQPARRRRGRPGARRFLTQSIAFLYAPKGTGSRTRRRARSTTRRATSAPAVEAMLEHEREVARSRADFEGLVLRYGQFYGPGTYYAPRRAPRPRKCAGAASRSSAPGTGTFSFLHVEDAAGRHRRRARPRRRPASTTSSTTSPRRCSEWLPVYAEALGAKPPRRVPLWLARLVAGGRRRRRRSSCAAPPTPRRSASWAGSRATRAGARASARRSASARASR